MKGSAALKALLKKSAFMAFLVLCSFTALVIAPFSYGYHFASIINKREMVRRFVLQEKPLMAFYGGSGLWVGLDSASIGRELNCNVANTGVFAGFGLSFVPEDLMDLLRAGDTLVIIPEYGLLYDSLIDPDRTTRKWCLAMSPRRALRSLYNGWTDTGELLIDIASLCQYKIVGLLRGILENPGRALFEGGYVNYSKRANQYGDSVKNDFPLLDRRSISGYGELFPDREPGREVYRRFNALYSRAAAKGVKVFLTFCAFPSDEYERNRVQLERLDRSLRTHLLMPVIGAPSDFVLDYRYFSNTVYHLTMEGRSVRTSRLISLLKKHMRPDERAHRREGETLSLPTPPLAAGPTEDPQAGSTAPPHPSHESESCEAGAQEQDGSGDRHWRDIAGVHCEFPSDISRIRGPYLIARANTVGAAKGIHVNMAGAVLVARPYVALLASLARRVPQVGGGEKARVCIRPCGVAQHVVIKVCATKWPRL